MDISTREAEHSKQSVNKRWSRGGERESEGLRTHPAQMVDRLPGPTSSGADKHGDSNT